MGIRPCRSSGGCHQLLCVEAQIRAQVSPCGIVVDKVTLGQIFLRVLRFSPVSIIPPLFHILSCIVWGMDNGPVSGRSPHGDIVLPYRNNTNYGNKVVRH
jgi:hypothetical protein